MKEERIFEGEVIFEGQSKDNSGLVRIRKVTELRWVKMRNNIKKQVSKNTYFVDMRADEIGAKWGQIDIGPINGGTLLEKKARKLVVKMMKTLNNSSVTISSKN